ALTNLDWSSLYSLSDPDSLCSKFCDILYGILDLYVPLRRFSTPSFPKWMSPTTRSLIKHKNRLHKRNTVTGDVVTCIEFKRLRAVTKVAIRNDYSSYLHSIQENISSNPQSVWSYINSKRDSSRLPRTMYLNGITYGNPQSIVNSFATFFSNSFINIPCTP